MKAKEQVLYELSSTELRRLQLIELDALKEVDRICRKYQLCYWLAGGTLLGAVRHEGFIPWDDDIDLGMPWKDYKKFCKICKTELSSDFFLQTIESDPAYPYIFGKLRRNNTLYIRKGQEHMKYHHGVPIDIFPWYPIPETPILGSIFIWIVARLKTIMWSAIGAKMETNPFKRFLYYMLSFIPHRAPYQLMIFMVNKCKKSHRIQQLGEPQLEKLYKRARKNRYKRHEKICIANLTDLQFEDGKFWAPKWYDEYLTQVYGNYMMLPPEKERVGHHFAAEINLGGLYEDIMIREDCQ